MVQVPSGFQCLYSRVIKIVLFSVTKVKCSVFCVYACRYRFLVK